MRQMTGRGILGALLSLSLGITAMFAACREPRPRVTTPQQAGSHVPSRTVGSSTSAPVSTTDAAAPDALAAKVAAARTCTAPSAKILNEPDGGVVFVNAWHRKDAGNLDRLEGVVSAISGARDRFRCCFDAWTPASPGEQGHLMLTMELDPKGKVENASVDAKRSTVSDPITIGCVLEVSRTLTYPASPKDRSTLVEYPFVIVR